MKSKTAFLYCCLEYTQWLEGMYATILTINRCDVVDSETIFFLVKPKWSILLHIPDSRRGTCINDL